MREAGEVCTANTISLARSIGAHFHAGHPPFAGSWDANMPRKIFFAAAHGGDILSARHAAFIPLSATTQLSFTVLTTSTMRQLQPGGPGVPGEGVTGVPALHMPPFGNENHAPISLIALGKECGAERQRERETRTYVARERNAAGRGSKAKDQESCFHCHMVRILPGICITLAAQGPQTDRCLPPHGKLFGAETHALQHNMAHRVMVM